MYYILVTYKGEEREEKFSMWSKLEDYAEQKVLLGCSVTIWSDK